LLLADATAAPAAPLASRYRLVGEHDVASELVLYSDGRFEYGLAAGALDEQAQGRWTQDGKTIRLTTVPKPKPAVFTLAATERYAKIPFSINVTWPDGRGIAGVDFILTFDRGEPLESYTQEYGWSLDPADKRPPRSLTLAMPMYGLLSQPFAIDVAKGNRFTFVLTPNDLGTVDFEDLQVTVGNHQLIMHRGGGELIYVSQRK
jgi:hypothetical protein